MQENSQHRTLNENSLLMEPSSLLNLSQSTSPKHNKSIDHVPKDKKQYTLPPTENHKFE